MSTFSNIVLHWQILNSNPNSLGYGYLRQFVILTATLYPTLAHTPSQQTKLLILKECQKINLCLDRTENKLEYICTNNLNEMEYKEEFDLDSERQPLSSMTINLVHMHQS